VNGDSLLLLKSYIVSRCRGTAVLWDNAGRSW